MIDIPNCHIEMTSDGYLHLRPSLDGGVNLALFDMAVHRFLREHPDYEVMGTPHRSAQSPHGEIDFIVLKMPPSE